MKEQERNLPSKGMTWAKVQAGESGRCEGPWQELRETQSAGFLLQDEVGDRKLVWGI